MQVTEEKEGKGKMAEGLSQTIVGPVTAEEIGWKEATVED